MYHHFFLIYSFPCNLYTFGCCRNRIAQNFNVSVFNISSPIAHNRFSHLSLSSFTQKKVLFQAFDTRFRLAAAKAADCTAFWGGGESCLAEIDASVVLLIIDVSRPEMWPLLKCYDSQLTASDQGEKPLAQSRNNTQSQAAARGIALFMRLTKYRSAARTRRDAPLVVRGSSLASRELCCSATESFAGKLPHKQVERATKAFWRQPPRGTLCVYGYVLYLYVRVCVRPRVSFPKSLPQNGDRDAHIYTYTDKRRE